MQFRAAEEHLKGDKYIGPLIKKYGHCTIVAKEGREYFENLVDAITSQQLSGKAAKTIFNRVVEKCKKLTPKAILALDIEELRSCGLSYAKCSYVKDLAQKVMDGDLKVNKLDKLDDEEVLKELVAVKGIGEWTAQMFLMFTLARPNIFPALDLGIKNGLKKLTGKEMKPKEMLEFAKRWEPYKTVASWYIWKSLDNK